jgi:hypothetical protein
MGAKSLIFWGMLIGSVVGGYVPVLFGAGLLSYISILGNGIGALLGIYLGYKLSEYF